MKRVLTIGGSAAQGSAGIQADLKTFEERNVYGMSVITATVANNSRTEKGIFIRSTEEIEAQFYAVQEMVGYDACKTGMLFSKEIIQVTVKMLKEFPPPSLIVDPVMIGKMGSQLLSDAAIITLKKELIPIADLITPNRLEASRLINRKIEATISDLKQAAVELFELGPRAVLVKGGVIDKEAVDVLYDGKGFEVFKTHAIDTIHTSGAGCSYAASITAEVAKGYDLVEGISKSKQFVQKAIEEHLDFDRGVGSVRHSSFRAQNRK
ncbi:bifunctional hydroxymethylpyrimidine kinase/phosphomethylpyrimidine kinase [Saliterribacillus persicus]|uniref:Hydroxymethylpyrimidine/phosphomethylpyrimidine kinase n=1 Tax=Saliterribacillus persicus TaxID=930114 RepID=A0A368Y133_9BACI|nr:bifunctional hydroxymethylpyrimidine kinase/phosphomethylpyrimidine kinase [Saliterribacillus persicus]RCW73096.1 pyridoxine kinase/hydroxymethylpyrimidine/phosphomethylpyrimidine kinase [Saliterribacillus persicus]